MSNDRRLVPLNDIPEEPVSWVFPNRIPRKAVTTLDGDPGQAKSTLTYDVIARVTRGRPMPNCTGASPPAGAVILGAEDALGNTVRPRLQAAGADLRRVYVYDRRRFADRPLVLPDDLGVIEVAAGEVGARLVVIDPFTAFLAGPANSDRAVRAAIGPLVGLAERLDLAVLLLRHLSKGGGSNPLYRGLGSIGVVAAARSALLAAPDPNADDPHQHVLAQVKTNLSAAPTLAYRTVKRGDVVTVEWLGESPSTAPDLTGGRADHSVLTEGAYVLYSLLADGPVWAADVYKLAGKAGVTRRTVERAKALLGVRSKKVGSGRGSRWYWELGDDDRVHVAFRDRDLEDLMDRLLYGGNGPPLSGDEWKGRNPPADTDGADDAGDDGLLPPP
jgi:putative DNA primase/helicase